MPGPVTALIMMTALAIAATIRVITEIFLSSIESPAPSAPPGPGRRYIAGDRRKRGHPGSAHHHDDASDHDTSIMG